MHHAGLAFVRRLVIAGMPTAHVSAAELGSAAVLGLSRSTTAQQIRSLDVRMRAASEVSRDDVDADRKARAAMSALSWTILGAFATGTNFQGAVLNLMRACRFVTFRDPPNTGMLPLRVLDDGTSVTRARLCLDHLCRPMATALHSIMKSLIILVVSGRHVGRPAGALVEGKAEPRSLYVVVKDSVNRRAVPRALELEVPSASVTYGQVKRMLADRGVEVAAEGGVHDGTKMEIPVGRERERRRQRLVCDVRCKKTADKGHMIETAPAMCQPCATTPGDKPLPATVLQAV